MNEGAIIVSGPKISFYELDNHGKQIVLEQMNCESTSLMYAEQIRSLLKEIPLLKSQMDVSISKIERFCEDEQYKKDAIETIRSTQMSLSQQLAEVEKKLKNNVPIPSQKYYITEEAVAEKRKQLKIISLIREEILKIKKTVDEFIELGNKVFKEKENATTDTIIEYLSNNDDDNDIISYVDLSEVRERISIDISGCVSFDVTEDNSETYFEQRKKRLKDELIRLKECQLSQELLSSIDSAIQKLSQIHDEEYLTTFVSISVKGLMKKSKEYLEEQNRLKEEFEVLHNNYIALCIMLGNDPAKERAFHDIQELNDTIKTLEMEFVKRQEQSFISECIDEVMTEMGYNVLGSRDVTKKNGKHFHNELYHYGDGTAVNVTYSSDGKIAMELGGVDKTDRLPDERETVELCEQMESFCGDFKEIEKRLVAKGIVLSDRISLLPPNPEYAQIINTEDYNMIGEAESLQVRKRQTATSASKSMKVDN